LTRGEQPKNMKNQ